MTHVLGILFSLPMRLEIIPLTPMMTLDLTESFIAGTWTFLDEGSHWRLIRTGFRPTDNHSSLSRQGTFG